MIDDELAGCTVCCISKDDIDFVDHRCTACYSHEYDDTCSICGYTDTFELFINSMCITCLNDVHNLFKFG